MQVRWGAGELAFRPLVGRLAKLRGLLGTGVGAEPVALVGCAQVHTFGMRYRIDVAFVGAGGRVLGAWRSLPPGRVVGCRGAALCLERPHGRAPWPKEGELVVVEEEV